MWLEWGLGGSEKESRVWKAKLGQEGPKAVDGICLENITLVLLRDWREACGVGVRAKSPSRVLCQS